MYSMSDVPRTRENPQATAVNRVQPYRVVVDINLLSTCPEHRCSSGRTSQSAWMIQTLAHVLCLWNLVCWTYQSSFSTLDSYFIVVDDGAGTIWFSTTQECCSTILNEWLHCWTLWNTLTNTWSMSCLPLYICTRRIEKNSIQMRILDIQCTEEIIDAVVYKLPRRSSWSANHYNRRYVQATPRDDTSLGFPI